MRLAFSEGETAMWSGQMSIVEYVTAYDGFYKAIDVVRPIARTPELVQRRLGFSLLRRRLGPLARGQQGSCRTRMRSGRERHSMKISPSDCDDLPRPSSRSSANASSILPCCAKASPTRPWAMARSRCQSALLGSDLARRSQMARLSAGSASSASRRRLGRAQHCRSQCRRRRRRVASRHCSGRHRRSAP